VFLQKLVADRDFMNSLHESNTSFVREFDETFLVIFLVGGLLLYFIYPLLESFLGKRRDR
jgi:hypothetical protein